MIFGLFLLFIIFAAWHLLIRGLLWKSIIFFGSWFGIYFLLKDHCPSTHKVAIIFSNYSFTWASVIPTTICLLALLTTKQD